MARREHYLLTSVSWVFGKVHKSTEICQYYSLKTP